MIVYKAFWLVAPDFGKTVQVRYTEQTRPFYFIGGRLIKGRPRQTTPLANFRAVNFRERGARTIHYQCGAIRFRERDARTIHYVYQCGAIRFRKRNARTTFDYTGARSGSPQ